MAGVNLRFASISEAEILKIQDDAASDNKKKAKKLGLKFSKVREAFIFLPTSV